MIEWYRWDVLTGDAQNCLDFINGSNVFSIVGNIGGNPKPENQQTTKYADMTACTDGKFGFPKLSFEWLTKLGINQNDIDTYSPIIETFDPAWIPE